MGVAPELLREYIPVKRHGTAPARDDAQVVGDGGGVREVGDLPTVVVCGAYETPVAVADLLKADVEVDAGEHERNLRETE